MKIGELVEDGLAGLFGKDSNIHRLYNPDEYIEVDGQRLPVQAPPRPTDNNGARAWDDRYGGTHDPETGQVIRSEPSQAAGPAGETTNRAVAAYRFFIQQGLTAEQAAGFVGNLQAESGPRLDHTAVGDGGRAWGIAQWHPDRRRIWEQWKGRRWTRQNPPGFREQLQFIWYELQNSERRAFSKIRSTNTVAEAAVAVDRFYERSSGAHRQRRINYAREIYRSMQGNSNQ